MDSDRSSLDDVDKGFESSCVSHATGITNTSNTNGVLTKKQSGWTDTDTDRLGSSESDSRRQKLTSILAKAKEEFRQKAYICEKCHQRFLPDAGLSADSMFCIPCWIATRKIGPIQKIAEAMMIDEPALDNIAANIRERKISRLLLRRLIVKMEDREVIFNSKLVSSIRDATANLTRTQEYEIEDMKNQDLRDVL